MSGTEKTMEETCNACNTRLALIQDTINRMIDNPGTPENQSVLYGMLHVVSDVRSDLGRITDHFGTN